MMRSSGGEFPKLKQYNFFKNMGEERQKLLYKNMLIFKKKNFDTLIFKKNFGRKWQKSLLNDLVLFVGTLNTPSLKWNYIFESSQGLNLAI